MVCILLLVVACTPQEFVDPYVFGVVLPLTGTNAFYGEYARQGIDLAVEDINKGGGINGRLLKVVYEDAGGDSVKAAAVVKKLVELDDVDALFTQTTPLSALVSSAGEGHQIPTIYVSVTSTFAKNKTFVFKDYVDSADLCEVLARQAVVDGHAKIALFGPTTESTTLCEQGIKRVRKLSVTELYAFGDSDFRTQLAKIRQSKSSALVTSALSGDCQVMYKQMGEQGLNVTLYIHAGTLGCGSDESIKGNGNLLKGAYGSDIALSESSPEFMSFERRLKERGEITQLRGSALFYDVLMQMASAYRGCDDRRCVVDNLRALDYSGVSGNVRYNGAQIAEREIALLRYETGKWQAVVQNH